MTELSELDAEITVMKEAKRKLDCDLEEAINRRIALCGSIGEWVLQEDEPEIIREVK